MAYNIINHDLLLAFTKRWHKEIFNFHLPGGEMIVTLVNMYCLLYLTIEGCLLDHDEQLTKEAKMMEEMIGVDPYEVDWEVDGTIEDHAWFNYLVQHN